MHDLLDLKHEYTVIQTSNVAEFYHPVLIPLLCNKCGFLLIMSGAYPCVPHAGVALELPRPGIQ